MVDKILFLNGKAITLNVLGVINYITVILVIFRNVNYVRVGKVEQFTIICILFRVCTKILSVHDNYRLKLTSNRFANRLQIFFLT